jgi:hypothetical protein
VSDYPREKIVNSSKKRGTYMHRYLAIKFATWLDVNFEIWVIKTIDDFLFAQYNIHRKKVVEIEESKKRLTEYRNQLLHSKDEMAVKFVVEFENLEKLKKEKSAAIALQTRNIQLELFKN